jgi:hypothetical protein
VEDRRATVPAIEHMVGVSGYLSAWNTRHEKSTVRQTGTGTQEKVACPLFLCFSCARARAESGYGYW